MEEDKGAHHSASPMRMQNPVTTAETINEIGRSHVSTKTFLGKLIDSSCHPLLFRGILLILLPIWIWLTAFTVLGNYSLPGGSIFVLIILACGGRLLGYVAHLIRLPPMLGMLGLGLLIRNAPYVTIGNDLDPAWSAPIRQIALAVILTRAGLGLDMKILLKLKNVIFRLAVVPTTVEGITVAVISHYLLNFPWSWAFLLGFVLAPVSPAVVVPRLLELRDKGYGLEKGIPTFIIAAACLDNVLAISLFGVTLNFVFPTGSLGISIIQGPLQFLIGFLCGIGWGSFLGLLFSSDSSEDSNLIFTRFVLTFGGGIISVIGLSKLGYSGAGALGCLLSSFTATSIWRERRVFSEIDPLCSAFYILWYIFEPLLFGVIGCQIDVYKLELSLVYCGIGIIASGVFIRLWTSFIVVTCAGLTIKEKLFASISWIAKATVQAAIGPVALDMVPSHGNKTEDKAFAEQVLTLAVLSILLTAAIGELGVIVAGPKFLRKVTASNPESPSS